MSSEVALHIWKEERKKKLPLNVRPLKKLLLTISLLSISVSALMILPVSAPNGPYLSKVSFTFVTEGTRVTQMTKTSPTLDECPDLIRPGDVFALAIAGKKILYTMGGHLTSFVFNLRNYTIADPPYWGAGYPHSYDKRFLLDPWFRLAIAYLTPKAMIIGQIFRWIAVRVDSVVPPQMYKYYNPRVTIYDYDPEKAVQTLLDHGYYRIGSAPSWYWAYDAAGTQPLANVDLLSPTNAESPTSFTIVNTVVSECRNIGLRNIRRKSVAFNQMLSTYVYPQLFDMMFLSWKGLGPDPDHLWSFFNSVNDVYQGRNHPGLHDAQIDALTDIVHTSLDDEGQVVPAAMQVQALLADPTEPYGLCYIPIYSRIYYDAYQPNLEGIVEMPLVGSDNYWTSLNMHWKPPAPAGNGFTGPLFSGIDSFNPLVAGWTDEIEILPFGACQEDIMSPVFDRLMNKNPYTLEDVPGMAEYREIQTYTGPTADFGYVDGTKFTYRLRPGLKWHCGAAFTTSDIKFALDYVAWNQPGQWVNAWEDYVGTKVVDATHVEIYYNKTSLWLKDTVETVAAMLPKHIWNDANDDGVEGDPVMDWRHFNLWQSMHWPYNIPIPGAPPGTLLMKLCGTGPFIFDIYNPTTQKADLWANPSYWRSQASVASDLADMFYWFGDITKDGVVDDADITRAGLGWGSIIGEPRYEKYKDADIAPRPGDGYIDVEDLRMVGVAFGKKIWY